MADWRPSTSERDVTHPVDAWHDMVRRRDPSRLGGLLADDVVFHSPVVHTPQRGRELTQAYLVAAFSVLLVDTFSHTREMRGERDAALEFTVELDGIHVNGVDLLHWDDDDGIDDVKVLLRPLKAVNLVHRLMGELLEQSR